MRVNTWIQDYDLQKGISCFNMVVWKKSTGIHRISSYKPILIPKNLDILRYRFQSGDEIYQADFFATFTMEYSRACWNLSVYAFDALWTKIHKQTRVIFIQQPDAYPRTGANEDIQALNQCISRGCTSIHMPFAPKSRGRSRRGRTWLVSLSTPLGIVM